MGGEILQKIHLCNFYAWFYKNDSDHFLNHIMNTELAVFSNESSQNMGSDNVLFINSENLFYLGHKKYLLCPLHPVMVF